MTSKGRVVIPVIGDHYLFDVQGLAMRQVLGDGTCGHAWQPRLWQVSSACIGPASEQWDYDCGALLQSFLKALLFYQLSIRKRHL